MKRLWGFIKKKACQGNNQVQFIKTNDKHLMYNLLPNLLKMKIKLTIFFIFSVEIFAPYENVSIEKRGLPTPPNFPLVSGWSMKKVLTAPWIFYMRLPYFPSAPIPTKLSTWKMSFKTGMKSSWFWNSKYFLFLQSV